MSPPAVAPRITPHSIVNWSIARFRAGEADVGEIFQFLANDMVAKHTLGADRNFFLYLEYMRQTAAR